MSKEIMKNISKLLVMVMIMTIVLPQGTYKNEVNRGIQAAEQEVSTTDIITSTTANPENLTTNNLEETTSESESTTEEPTTEEPTTEEPTTEEPTTEQPTINPDFVIENGVLKQYLKKADDTANKEIIIPASVTRIDNDVFKGYTYIEKVSFEENSLIKEIGEQAFEDCSRLTSIDLPEGLTSIGIESFRNCKKLSNIIIPTTVTKLYKRSLYGCSAIKKLELPKGLKTIGYHAFYKMMGITTITIPSTVTSANEMIGTKSNIKTVIFEKGMTKIPTNALLNTTSVTTVTMYSGLLTIGSGAFRNCQNLTSAKIPSTVKTIGSNAYRECTSLKKLTLYKAVTSIGSTAFYGDKVLTLKVYANSYGKSYARKNSLVWVYTASEKRRMAEDKRVYDLFTSKNEAKYKDKYKLKYLSNYIPQGTCVIGSYVVVSMYHKSLSKKSMLLVYDKSGNYIKRVNLTVKDHVGSVTNVKKRLVVGINNVPGSKDQIGVITYKSLKNAKNGSTLKFKYRLNLSGAADFAAYDGQYLWAGRSANSNSCLMYGYKVTFTKKGKIKLANHYNLYVPANTQGLIVQKKSKYKRKIIVSQSYGRIADSKFITYNSVNIKTASSLGTASTTITLPSMIEGICMNGSNLYMVFESAAGKYCSNPDNTSEIKINNARILKYNSILSIK